MSDSSAATDAGSGNERLLGIVEAMREETGRPNVPAMWEGDRPGP